MLVIEVLGHDDLVSASYLSSDGQHLVTGGYDKTVRFWKIAPGKNASCIQVNLLSDGGSMG